jgi:hypothetical protein
MPMCGAAGLTNEQAGVRDAAVSTIVPGVEARDQCRHQSFRRDRPAGIRKLPHKGMSNNRRFDQSSGLWVSAV